ncbi:MAG TPA: nucleotidyltransferase family protein [Acetobacteraceae bacterium]|nr:nucleotidyltransferase family protein [Acetobacteraceae bacterium]
MSTGPRTALVLAAGLGRRMRPLTETLPKPLLPLGGRTLLDHVLDRLAEAEVTMAVVNAHWHAARIEAHLAARGKAGLPPATLVRPEATLLETGGAARAARDLLGPDPFYVVNGDSFWLNGPCPALARLRHAWEAGGADCVLLVHRAAQAHAEVGYGDFALDPWGRLRRRGEREVVPYIYAGAQIIGPALLEQAPDGAFSMNLLWDRAIAAGRARAVVHDGPWFHLSTPADLAEAEAILNAGLPG